MYTKKNIVYAEAGKYLLCRHRDGGVHFCYQCTEGVYDVEENDVITSDMRIVDRAVMYNRGRMVEMINAPTKAELKTSFIHKRYTNDDQIAIMLNREYGPSEQLDYERMQAWRDWSGRMADLILTLINSR